MSTFFSVIYPLPLQVFQYMITIMVALMVTQHAIERYWTSTGGPITSMQKLMLAVFLSYPLITLLLVILSSNEVAIRRFMYYRLMSLQVIVDWQNTPFYKVNNWNYASAHCYLAPWLGLPCCSCSCHLYFSNTKSASVLLHCMWCAVVLLLLATSMTIFLVNLT